MNDQPIQSNKHILIAAAGNTPQIVTETLYALMVKQHVPISAVYIVTTAKGKRTAWQNLGGTEGQIAKLCREYGIAAGSVQFSEDQILTIKRQENGQEIELEDIRTKADNQLFSAQLFSFMEQMTADVNTSLYCSIAGGRKTMSAYLMLALTLYGRAQDKLLHVLVPEQFETNPKFYFPPKKNEQIAVRNAVGEMIVEHTKNAQIELAEIPIIFLRDCLPPTTFQQLKGDVATLIKIAQVEIVKPTLVRAKLIIDLSRKTAFYGSDELDLQPAKLTFLAYYADRKVHYCVEPKRDSCVGCRACFQSDGDVDKGRYFDLIRSQYTGRSQGSAEEKIQRMTKAFDYPYDLLKTNRTITNAATTNISRDLEIISFGDRGEYRYGIALDKTLIEIKGVKSPLKK